VATDAVKTRFPQHEPLLAAAPVEVAIGPISPELALIDPELVARRRRKAALDSVSD